jgi:CheY-like chemotaxis protein
MAIDLEFLNPSYKPALLALTADDVITACKDMLRELNYKVLVATSHEEFAACFNNVQFQVVILDEQFASQTADGNQSLRMLQHMPMQQRRHATVILLGHEFQTLHTSQAFAQSAHAVVNWADLGSLSQIVQQVAADNSLFLNAFREAQLRVGQGKA